ncbi:hypothetical protein NMY22_g7569 [Coprinellus aureogranulatus]|nr:hypothetical protein NMY22_g7569 [Coprinellus aureogranulatus]
MQTTITTSFNGVGNELAAVRGKLEVIRNQEGHYAELLHQLEGLKFSAICEREGLEERERELVALIQSPVNRLPNEVLGQIFVFLAETEIPGGTTTTASPIPPSIIVSHVNQRWRAVVLSTAHAWSSINLRGRWDPERVRLFVSRSNGVPLGICYTSPCSLFGPPEVDDVTAILSLLANEWHRIRILEVNTATPAAMVPFIQILNDATKCFNCLSSLSLNISTFNPQHTIADGLLKNNGPDQSYIPPKTPIPTWSHLSHLKLQEIPLFNLPYHLTANLVSLELNYPPRKARITSRTRYWLTASALLRFLSLTPKLEELVLNNTYPIFDGALAVSAVSQQTVLGSILPIQLTRLKTISWSFPSLSSQDAYNLMSLLDTPSLEKVDMWVENCKVASVPANAPRVPATPLVIDYPTVRELCFQSSGDDNSLNALRKFTFPSLEYVELGSIPPESGEREKLKPLPRLESVFRDPRQPYLTHLALSNFDFNTEHSRSFFGYMPALASLSLEFCSGAAYLIKILAETCPLDLKAVSLAIRGEKRGVRFCPNLEALSFWGCNDLRIETLIQVVLARNDCNERMLMCPGMLSAGCCERLQTAAADDAAFNISHIVQILAIKQKQLVCKDHGYLNPQSVYILRLSDGVHYTHGILPPSLNHLLPRNNAIQPLTLAVIEKSACARAMVNGREEKVIFVQTLNVIGQCPGVIGSPSQLNIPSTAYSELTANPQPVVHGVTSSPETLSDNAHPHKVTSVPVAGPTGSVTEGGADAGVAASSVGRPIKPLRKSMRQPSVSSSASPGPGQNTRGDQWGEGYPMAFVAHEVAPPSPVVYTRIHDCPLINADHALHLKNLVADVIWIGNE